MEGVANFQDLAAVIQGQLTNQDVFIFSKAFASIERNTVIVLVALSLVVATLSVDEAVIIGFPLGVND